MPHHSNSTWMLCNQLANSRTLGIVKFQTTHLLGVLWNPYRGLQFVRWLQYIQVLLDDCNRITSPQSNFEIFFFFLRYSSNYSLHFTTREGRGSAKHTASADCIVPTCCNGADCCYNRRETATIHHSPSSSGRRNNCCRLGRCCKHSGSKDSSFNGGSSIKGGKIRRSSLCTDYHAPTWHTIGYRPTWAANHRTGHSDGTGCRGSECDTSTTITTNCRGGKNSDYISGSQSNPNNYHGGWKQLNSLCWKIVDRVYLLIAVFLTLVQNNRTGHKLSNIG